MPLSKLQEFMASVGASHTCPEKRATKQIRSDMPRQTATLESRMQAQVYALSHAIAKHDRNFSDAQARMLRTEELLDKLAKEHEVARTQAPTISRVRATADVTRAAVVTSLRAFLF